jgi:hypothetical protein
MALKVVAGWVNKLVQRKRYNLGVRAGSAGQGLGFCRVQLGKSTVEHSYVKITSQQCCNLAAMQSELGLFRLFRKKSTFWRETDIYGVSVLRQKVFFREKV